MFVVNTRPVTVRKMPVETWRRLRLLCFRREIPVYQLLTDLIEKELKKAKV